MNINHVISRANADAMRREFGTPNSVEDVHYQWQDYVKNPENDNEIHFTVHLYNKSSVNELFVEWDKNNSPNKEEMAAVIQHLRGIAQRSESAQKIVAQRGAPIQEIANAIQTIADIDLSNLTDAYDTVQGTLANNTKTLKQCCHLLYTVADMLDERANLLDGKSAIDRTIDRENQS